VSLVGLLNIFIQLAGFSMLVLAFGHSYLAKLLDWKDDLAKLKPINEQVFFAHTIFLTGGIALLGLSCLFFAPALTARSTLGAVAAACFAMCWLSRLVCQFVVFKADISPDAGLNSFLRLAGTLLWIFYTALFTIVFVYQLGVLDN
jgi:hypothetical protein